MMARWVEEIVRRLLVFEKFEPGPLIRMFHMLELD